MLDFKFSTLFIEFGAEIFGKYSQAMSSELNLKLQIKQN